MLTQLATLKARLGLPESDVKDDDLLNALIEAVSGRFDKETNRTLARGAAVTEEFSGEECELRPARYPIESVSAFALKSDETTGWETQEDVVFLIRKASVISLAGPLGTSAQQLRVTYTGGYVLPGATVSAGQTALPKELEEAAILQVVNLYQNKDRQGIASLGGAGGSVTMNPVSVVAPFDLLPLVMNTLKKYERWVN